jgi:glycosyltransferase involved in cell wall biosynthesis
MRKPKIAIIGTRGYPVVYSGFETWVKELCEGLCHKYEFHVYTHKKLSNDRRTEINGIHIHYFNAIETKFLSQWSHTLQATWHAIHQQYDILLYASTANGVFGYLTKLYKQRTAINVDGLDWLRPKWKGLAASVFYLSAKMAVRNFDVLISDADAIQEYYRKHLKADSVSIAYGARMQTEHSGLKGLKHIQAGNYFLCVGRIIPDNHLLEIIKGFKQSKAEQLVIVGDLPYKDKYFDKIKKEADERIVFTGYVKDPETLKALYRNCLAYIHGHAYGGTNPSLLKALGYGCCVLAHDNVFNREMLLSGEYGCFFTSDVTSIANAINYIIDNPEVASSLRTKAPERITTHYTWEKILNQYDALFQRMLAEPNWKCNYYTFTASEK